MKESSIFDDVEFVVEEKDMYGCVKIAALHEGYEVGSLNFLFGYDQAYLSSISVIPFFKRYGIGSKLIALFEEECVKQDISTIVGIFKPRNEAVGRAFYGKLGYEIYLEDDQYLLRKQLILENVKDVEHE